MPAGMTDRVYAMVPLVLLCLRHTWAIIAREDRRAWMMPLCSYRIWVCTYEFAGPAYVTL